MMTAIFGEPFFTGVEFEFHYERSLVIKGWFQEVRDKIRKFRHKKKLHF